MFGLPRTKGSMDSILVVVDQFSKMSHFIACHKSDDDPYFACLFVENVFKLISNPQSMVSDRHPNFFIHF